MASSLDRWALKSQIRFVNFSTFNFRFDWRDIDSSDEQRYEHSTFHSLELSNFHSFEVSSNVSHFYKFYHVLHFLLLLMEVYRTETQSNFILDFLKYRLNKGKLSIETFRNHPIATIKFTYCKLLTMEWVKKLLARLVDINKFCQCIVRFHKDIAKKLTISVPILFQRISTHTLFPYFTLEQRDVNEKRFDISERAILMEISLSRNTSHAVSRGEFPDNRLFYLETIRTLNSRMLN